MAVLPLIDEVSTVVAAPAERTLSAAIAAVGGRAARSPVWRAFARVLGCADLEAHGDPRRPGARIPGFHVVRADERSEWALAGEHRFARYALAFRVEPLAGEHSRLIAESRAEFPGVLGTAYKGLVVGSRGHAVAVRGMLRGIKRTAET